MDVISHAKLTYASKDFINQYKKHTFKALNLITKESEGDNG